MKIETFEDFKREEARQRMAALRRARKSPEAAAEEQRKAGMLDGSAGVLMNLKEVFSTENEGSR
ncbi:MAG TPA: hypothetical protein DCY13_25130 [Verrucomicrobiales bacterium]|nr:hypothetical protein [Verrucomicrobiales bacterium]